MEVGTKFKQELTADFSAVRASTYKHTHIHIELNTNMVMSAQILIIFRNMT